VNQNYILVWKYDEHLYVILVFNQRVWLADGVDAIKRNRSAQSLIRRYIGKQFTMCTVGGQQTGADYCGSSAVLICLEFLRMMKTGVISERLILPVGLKRSLVKKLHPHKTTKLGAQSAIKKVTQILVCKYCAQSFKNKGARRLKMHEAKCPQRLSKE